MQEGDTSDPSGPPGSSPGCRGPRQRQKLGCLPSCFLSHLTSLCELCFVSLGTGSKDFPCWPSGKREGLTTMV